MSQEFWLGILATGIIVPLIAIVVREIKKYSGTEKAEIIIQPPADLDGRSIKFGLLHVRDGKDEIDDRGPLLNKVHWFKPAKNSLGLKVHLRYQERH